MALKPITVNTPPAQAAHILAEDDAALYAGIIGGDCVLPIGGKLNASVISNNKVRITDGVVVVGGHIARIEKGDYEDMTIANGTSGKKRNDIIVARFIAGIAGGADSYKLVVVQGASGATAIDPTIVRGDLYNGDKQRDCPLWRIKIEGISIVKVEQMHEIGTTNKYLAEKAAAMKAAIDQLNRNIKFDISHAWENPSLSSALYIDLENPYGDNNRPCIISEVTTEAPPGIAWGVREVLYLFENAVVIRVTGLKNDGGTTCIWVRAYNYGRWTAWREC